MKETLVNHVTESRKEESRIIRLVVDEDSRIERKAIFMT
jgi:hypothetical protein